MTRTLVLLRHGQSEWNLRNLFTGWRDPGLTERGEAEATAAGLALRGAGLSIDKIFVSDLSRANETARLAREAFGGPSPEPIVHMALRERSYGDLSGLNKDEARAKWGEEQVRLWRRSYDTPPPNGESLKDTVARTLPYYCREILPCVLRGETTLVVAHGNSLRALVMVLEGHSTETIATVEIHTGVPLLYRLGVDSRVDSHEVIRPPIEPRA